MVADRASAAMRLLQLERLIVARGSGEYGVQSENSAKVYTVNTVTGKCDCLDFVYRLAGGDLGECKHLLAVRLCYPEGQP